MAGSSLVMFRVLASRSTADAKQLLGKFAGVLMTDRYGAYNWVELRQVCWAHLKRDFKALSERDGDAHDWGLAFLALLPPVFDQWHRFKDGTLTRSALGMAMQPHMDEMDRLIAEGVLSEDDHLARFCGGLHRAKDALWTFVSKENVEPTNNHAERVLRHAVILRKIIFGTDSPDGAVRLERMLSAVMSLRLQKRNVFNFLEQACRAHLHGTQPPSLLPAAVIGA